MILLKCLKWLLVVILCTILFIAGINAWMIYSTKNVVYTLEEAKQFSGDCILVLGCGIRSDGKPSHMLQDRLDVAIAAYQNREGSPHVSGRIDPHFWRW